MGAKCGVKIKSVTRKKIFKKNSRMVCFTSINPKPDNSCRYSHISHYETFFFAVDHYNFDYYYYLTVSRMRAVPWRTRFFRTSYALCVHSVRCTIFVELVMFNWIMSWYCRTGPWQSYRVRVLYTKRKRFNRGGKRPSEQFQHPP